jgi:hypothetical protein
MRLSLCTALKLGLLGSSRPRRAARPATRSMWRSVVAPDGDGFAPWVRALEGKSGAYLIRSKQTGEYIYAGESHTGNLRKTLCRHFHEWERKRRSRSPYNAAEGGFKPGTTYGRHHYEVRVVFATGKAAIKAQNRLIRKFKPRDNELGAAPAAGGEEVPF